MVGVGAGVLLGTTDNVTAIALVPTARAVTVATAGDESHAAVRISAVAARIKPIGKENRRVSKRLRIVPFYPLPARLNVSFQTKMQMQAYKRIAV
jgi:hypothetical protein